MGTDLRNGYHSIRLIATAPLSSQCLLGKSCANQTRSGIHGSFTITSHNITTYFAQTLYLQVGLYEDASGTSVAESPPVYLSLAFWFGYVDIENMDNSSDTLLVCEQQLEQVTANVTLTYPGYSISRNHPPIPDEITATLLPSGPNNETAFKLRLNMHMGRCFLLFNQSQPLTAEDKAAQFQLKITSFFKGVLKGKTPLPMGTLLDSATTFMGIQRFYRQYMAQAISSNMRITLNTTFTSPLKVGQTTDDFPPLQRCIHLQSAQHDWYKTKRPSSHSRSCLPSCSSVARWPEPWATSTKWSPGARVPSLVSRCCSLEAGCLTHRSRRSVNRASH